MVEAVRMVGWVGLYNSISDVVVVGHATNPVTVEVVVERAGGQAVGVNGGVGGCDRVVSSRLLLLLQAARPSRAHISKTVHFFIFFPPQGNCKNYIRDLFNPRNVPAETVLRSN